jgi:hypothetical protein
MSLKSQANKKGQEREAHPEYLEETRPTMLRHTCDDELMNDDADDDVSDVCCLCILNNVKFYSQR